MLKVTIPFAFERAEVKERKGRLLQKKGLTDNQKKVYEYLFRHPEDSLRDAAENTGLSLAGVKKICQKLQEYGLLEREGAKKNGSWKIKSTKV